MMPNEGVHSGIGSRVVVAWNGRREATRAAFDALPLLQQAKEVKVLWVDPRPESEDAGAFAATDLCAALARHGITRRSQRRARATSVPLCSAGPSSTARISW
jgi:hypothetical protein